MREDICSIPINEVFEPKDGCPICRMRDMLEDRMATYITGAAMMEPDVRVETNRLGFCGEHFNQILARGSRLSVALIQESLLHEVEKDVFEDTKGNPKKATEAIRKRSESCFICDSLGDNMQNLIRNMLTLWQAEPEFRELYSEQPYMCLEHYGMVMEQAQKMPRRNLPPFSKETERLCREYLHNLQTDVTHFTRMFDYRNQGADWGTSVDAIERTIEYLTSRKPTIKPKAEEKNR